MCVCYNHRMNEYQTFREVWDTTLGYSNIFDYPLTDEELYTFMLCNTAMSKETFESLYTKHKSHLLEHYEHDGTYWALKGRHRIFQTRTTRNARAELHINLTRNTIAPILAILPWVQLAAITGSTAAKNPLSFDDVDLFIITKPKRKWLVRAIVLLYLSISNSRKNISFKQQRPVFCMNHIIDTKTLIQNRQNAFIANEIARMHVFINRNNTLATFLAKNTWLSTYVPNWFLENKPNATTTTQTPKLLQHIRYFISAPFITPFILLGWGIDALDALAKYVQTRSNDKELTYHVRDNNSWIMRELNWIKQK